MSDAEYLKRLKLERDRERSHRKSRQGRFESSMLSLDRMTAEIDASKSSVFSDQGAGAEKVYAAVDGEAPETVYTRRLNVARRRLRRAHPKLMEVFNLIVRNGSNRKESICTLMMGRRRRWNAARQRYWRHLEKIMKFFEAQ